MNIKRLGLEPRHVATKNERVKSGTAGGVEVSISALAKSNSPISPYCVPNEYICAELARVLCLPVAIGGITISGVDSPQYSYTAMKFGTENERLTAIDPVRCVALFPEICTAIILFDIFIANSDRSENNLFFEDAMETLDLRIFDHEYALLGATVDQAEGRLTGSLVGQLGIAKHCLMKHVTAAQLQSSPWIQRIESMPDYFIEEVCGTASRFGLTPLETDTVIEFLKRRRQEILHLVKKHASEFKSETSEQ